MVFGIRSKLRARGEVGWNHTHAYYGPYQNLFFDNPCQMTIPVEHSSFVVPHLATVVYHALGFPNLKTRRNPSSSQKRKDRVSSIKRVCEGHAL